MDISLEQVVVVVVVVMVVVVGGGGGGGRMNNKVGAPCLFIFCLFFMDLFF